MTDHEAILLLRQRRLLLVLDGFEREPRAYAGLSAAYQGDALNKETGGEHRAYTDSHAGRFLRDADAALSIADHCDYQLAQADIHNFLARLTLEAGDRAEAHRHAEIAKERAWCDGRRAATSPPWTRRSGC